MGCRAAGVWFAGCCCRLRAHNAGGCLRAARLPAFWRAGIILNEHCLAYSRKCFLWWRAKEGLTTYQAADFGTILLSLNSSYGYQEEEEEDWAWAGKKVKD